MISSVASNNILKYKCTKFSGTAQYVNIGHFTTFDFEKNNPFSLSCWAKYSGSILISFINKLPAPSPSETGWDLYFSAGGAVGFTLKTTLSSMIGVQSTNHYNDGKWHHFVSTYDGYSIAAGVTMYVDGYSIVAPAFIDTLGSTIRNTSPLKIGLRPDYGSSMGPVDGALDVAVYNKKLSSAEVTAIYNKHCPPDLTVVGPTSSLVGYWLLGTHIGKPGLSSKATSYPTCPDAGSGAHDGTMTGMATTSIITRT